MIKRTYIYRAYIDDRWTGLLLSGFKSIGWQTENTNIVSKSTIQQLFPLFSPRCSSYMMNSDVNKKKTNDATIPALVAGTGGIQSPTDHIGSHRSRSNSCGQQAEEQNTQNQNLAALSKSEVAVQRDTNRSLNEIIKMVSKMEEKDPLMKWKRNRKKADEQFLRDDTDKTPFTPDSACKFGSSCFLSCFLEDGNTTARF